ncbi:2',3'-cyclic-nucleotide 3'-phosphodiesterase [Chaetomium fimeti]|uniref:2',3'-cyclic-nucleotide 3'-phosphodiesterase n=1 Tax=Chaetomium fimeti TaxID=1854472 RepID=A0AAE0H9F2_9PEZI|nr:2',3'-cyclic-nucleotide 3'-phosphodiesterase [Chaetomium fimeti]
MAGSSLWLLPPESHPLHALLKTLITATLPARFPREAASAPRVVPHFFPAHLTLTSGIDPATTYGDDPQGWLDRIDFSAASSSSGGDSGVSGEEGGSAAGGVKVRFERVEGQDVFYRRCFIRVAFEGVRALAGIARAVGVAGEAVEVDAEGAVKFGAETEKWLSSWREEFGPHVSLVYGNEAIMDGALREITILVMQAGVKLSEESLAGGEEKASWDGWDGGVVWLVPTDKPVSEWGKPIATRVL